MFYKSKWNNLISYKSLNINFHIVILRNEELKVLTKKSYCFSIKHIKRLIYTHVSCGVYSFDLSENKNFF